MLGVLRETLSALFNAACSLTTPPPKRNNNQLIGAVCAALAAQTQPLSSKCLLLIIF